MSHRKVRLVTVVDTVVRPVVEVPMSLAEEDEILDWIERHDIIVKTDDVLRRMIDRVEFGYKEDNE